MKIRKVMRMFLSLSSVGVFANAVDVAAIDTVVIIVPTADSTVAAAVATAAVPVIIVLFSLFCCRNRVAVAFVFSSATANAPIDASALEEPFSHLCCFCYR